MDNMEVVFSMDDPAAGMGVVGLDPSVPEQLESGRIYRDQKFGPMRHQSQRRNMPPEAQQEWLRVTQFLAESGDPKAQSELEKFQYLGSPEEAEDIRSILKDERRAFSRRPKR